MEVWSKKIVQDYDSVFDCLAYYHVKEDKLGLRAWKGVHIGFKKDVKNYKFWDPKDQIFILSKDVMFDEASMMKHTDSQ